MIYSSLYVMYHLIIIIIISLLMSPLLEHRPSLWIIHKENGPLPTTRAQCRLVGATCTTYVNIIVAINLLSSLSYILSVN
jgi:hypothetical protein